MNAKTTPSARAEQIWIPRQDGEHTAAAWFAPHATLRRGTAVLIVPGPAHEERAMAGGLAACAAALAGRGFGAMVVDLHGGGQSTGALDDPGPIAHWRADLWAARAAARGRGYRSTIVVGVRLGALIAAQALAGAGPDDTDPAPGFVAWLPILSGRRHVRELRLLAQAAPGAPLSIGGFDWPAALVDELGRLELGAIDVDAALLVDADDRAAAALGAACRVPVERRLSIDGGAWLFHDRDQPPLPQVDIESIAGWCVARDDAIGRAIPDASRPPAQAREAGGGPSVVFAHRGRRVREEAVELGIGRLAAVLCEPADTASEGPLRVLASTVGPGRTFVDFARDQAAAGHASIRFDFAGFGISPPAAGTDGGQVYAASGCEDVRAAIDHLASAGTRSIVLIGYCAGAWSMLEAAALRSGTRERGPTRIDAVVAVNVQLQRLPDAPERRLVKLQVDRLAHRISRWRNLRPLARWIERVAGQAPLGWVAALDAARVPVLLAYADDDPGLYHWRRHAGAGAPEHVRVEIVDRLGHLAENGPARRRLYDAIAARLAEVDVEVAARSARSAARAKPIADRPTRPAPLVWQASAWPERLFGPTLNDGAVTGY